MSAPSRALRHPTERALERDFLTRTRSALASTQMPILEFSLSFFPPSTSSLQIFSFVPSPKDLVSRLMAARGLLLASTLLPWPRRHSSERGTSHMHQCAQPLLEELFLHRTKRRRIPLLVHTSSFPFFVGGTACHTLLNSSRAPNKRDFTVPTGISKI